MMSAVLSIARYTVVQQFRNRLYLAVALFGAVIVASSLLFGALAADQEAAVVTDLGLAAIEFFGLASAVFGAVSLVLEEMESRTLYLILTRPLPRHAYIVGRFLGLLAAVSLGMMVMAALHASILVLNGWTPDATYAVAVPAMILKIAVATGLALFFSVFSSSSVSSIVFTLFFWMLGHFGAEMKFLLEKTENVVVVVVVKSVMFVAPDMRLLNIKDVIGAPGAAPDQLLWAAGYAVFYVGACLSLSSALFSQKEL